MAFIINFINRLRNQYILNWYQCRGTSGAATDQEQICNDFKYSVTISAGIGFIFLGNIYDNIDKPRQITVVFLVTLSVIAFFEALFYNQNNSDTNKQSLTVALTLYQMSSVFEAGVSLACIVIINNWFK